jgi:hypothetical protein
MTATAPEPNHLDLWLRRLWPAFCVLSALVIFGFALFDPYQIDGDAVSYMDSGDLIRSHNWPAVINGYWNPLYPALLALGHCLFHATRFTELHAYYLVNFGIFLLEMLAVVLFSGGLVSLRETLSSANDKPFLLDRYPLRYIALGLLLVAAQRELSMGKIRPDALLHALLLFALAALLRHLTTGQLRYAALLGITLGLAYLTKSFAFPFTLLCIAALVAFRLFWQKQSPARTTSAALLALACFSLVAGPYIAALSHQKHRFDIGESGSLNYAWFVSGTTKLHLQPGDIALFGASQVHLKHPETVLLQSPLVVSYKQLAYGTYPAWFDASFWNDRVQPHMNPHLQLVATANCIIRLFRYLANHPEGWLLLALLLFLGARPTLGWRPSSNVFWLAPVALGAAIICIYGMVYLEDRYVSSAFLFIFLPILAALRPSNLSQPEIVRSASTAVIFFMALLILGQSARSVGEMRRALIHDKSPGGWYDSDTFQAAHALNALGVLPGDTIACVGGRACLIDHYWARLAGVRILIEIYQPHPPLDPALADIPNNEQAIEAARQQGAKVLVGYFAPGLMRHSSTTGLEWRELGESPFYALPLNLPAAENNPLNRAVR